MLMYNIHLQSIKDGCWKRTGGVGWWTLPTHKYRYKLILFHRRGRNRGCKGNNVFLKVVKYRFYANILYRVTLSNRLWTFLNRAETFNITFKILHKLKFKKLGHNFCFIFSFEIIPISGQKQQKIRRKPNPKYSSPLEGDSDSGISSPYFFPSYLKYTNFFLDVQIFRNPSFVLHFSLLIFSLPFPFKFTFTLTFL